MYDLTADAGDTRQDADGLVLQETTSGNFEATSTEAIEVEDDVDWFHFDVPEDLEGKPILVTLSSENLRDATIAVYDK